MSRSRVPGVVAALGCGWPLLLLMLPVADSGEGAGVIELF